MLAMLHCQKLHGPGLVTDYTPVTLNSRHAICHTIVLMVIWCNLFDCFMLISPFGDMAFQLVFFYGAEHGLHIHRYPETSVYSVEIVPLCDACSQVERAKYIRILKRRDRCLMMVEMLRKSPDLNTLIPL